jgi:cysteine desulfurase
MLYLDNASTTKPSPEVTKEVIKCHQELFGNPSSKHYFGSIIEKKVEKSREKISNLINCDSSEIYFNSGSTEGINTVLRGYVEANIDTGNHIITTKVEHKAVLETCHYLENVGIDITYLDVDENGLIDIQELTTALKKETLLVSILWVNNETGVIQEINSIAEIVSKTNAKLFIDATQAIGKIPIDVVESKIDMLCISGHKFHGPKGIGAIYVKEGISITPLLHGGGQENGFRSGTTNVPGLAGLAKACELIDFSNINPKKINSYLEEKLKSNFNCQIIGENVNRSNYVSNVIIKGIDADIVISKLRKVMISSGSACTSRIVEPAHVLKNMGYSDEDSFSSLRFSISKYTTYEEVDKAIEELKNVIEN